MQVENTIDVNRPIEVVFAYITNPQNIKDLGLKDLHQTSPSPIGIGTTFNLVLDLFGRDFEIPAEVTEYQPYTTFRLKTTSGPFAFEQYVLLTPTDTGTTITITLDGDPGKTFKMAGPFLKAQLKKQLDTSMDEAKSNLESQ
jgi:carbon monoxide dehydrogenase subunit G